MPLCIVDLLCKFMVYYSTSGAALHAWAPVCRGPTSFEAQFAEGRFLLLAWKPYSHMQVHNRALPPAQSSQRCDYGKPCSCANQICDDEQAMQLCKSKNVMMSKPPWVVAHNISMTNTIHSKADNLHHHGNAVTTFILRIQTDKCNIQP